MAPLSLVLSTLQTESRNPNTAQIDSVNTIELCRIINSQDALVAPAVETCLPLIAEAINGIIPRIRKGGRIISFGAGTSGRLGVLDASELPPTFHAPPSQFIGLIAGGDVALRSSTEGAEDSADSGAQDLLRQSPTANDVVIGIASSGRTPYVLGALKQAHTIGCLTLGLACTKPSEMGSTLLEDRRNLCDVMIECVTGAEVVTGSTRLKAGTATKMILNMISTGVMIKLGKTYGNLMVDLKASNSKLKARAQNIVLSLCPDGMYTLEGRFLSAPKTADERVAWGAAVDALVDASDGSVKLAILIARLGCSVLECKNRLENARGVLAAALEGAEGLPASVTQRPSVVAEASIDSTRPRLVLCIDGGGTKTAAVIAQQGGGILARGEAGISNFTAVGLTASLHAIHAATANALASLPLTRLPPASLILPSPTGTPLFAKIWAGIAGVDRPPEFATLLPALSGLFSLPHTDGSIRLTNDGSLLSAPIKMNADTDEGVIVIAGTGSIAISFRTAEDGKMVQLRRSGGWGHLLGDEGSAFTTGRSAVRAILAAINSNEVLLPWHKEMLTYFGAEDEHQLISCVTTVSATAKGFHEAENDRKVRIASSAQIVFRAAFENGDQAALDVVRGTVRAIVELIGPLIKSASYSEGVTPAQSTLSLGGGLMRQRSFWELLVSEMKVRESWEWNKIEVVEGAAAMGALVLAEE